MSRPQSRQKSSHSSSSSLATAVRTTVEALENRTMLSVTIKSVFDSSENPGLEIKGNSSSDNVLIIDDQADGTIQIVANGKTTNYSGIVTFNADLGGGNDTLEYRLIAGGAVETRALHLDGDSGNDRITLTSEFDFGGDPDNLVNAVAGGLADFDVLIDGDSGNDTVNVNAAYIFDANLSLEITTDEGNDNVNVVLGSLRVAAAAPALSAVYGYEDPAFFIDVDLGAGKNNLTVSSEALAAGTTLDVNVKGGNTTGSNIDNVDIEVGGYGSGKQFIDVDLNGGDDVLRIHGDLETGSIPDGAQTPVTRMNLNGGEGKDRMTVELDEVYIHGLSYVNLQLKGGNGDDTLTADLDEAFVDFGGTLIVGVDGQNGNDTINASFNFIGGGITTVRSASVASAVTGILSPGTVDIALRGGQNTDRFNVFAAADVVAPFLQAITPSGGPILVEGQSGTDTIAFKPGADHSLFDVRNVEKVA